MFIKKDKISFSFLSQKLIKTDSFWSASWGGSLHLPSSIFLLLIHKWLLKGHQCQLHAAGFKRTTFSTATLGKWNTLGSGVAQLEEQSYLIQEVWGSYLVIGKKLYKTCKSCHITKKRPDNGTSKKDINDSTVTSF